MAHRQLHSPELMHLIRSLYFIAANNNFTLLITHIQGSHNNIADALSCFQMKRGRPNEWCNHSRFKALIRQEIKMVSNNIDVYQQQLAAWQ